MPPPSSSFNYLEIYRTVDVTKISSAQENREKKYIFVSQPPSFMKFGFRK